MNSDTRKTLRERVLAEGRVDPMIVHSPLEKCEERDQERALQAQESNYGER